MLRLLIFVLIGYTHTLIADSLQEEEAIQKLSSDERGMSGIFDVVFKNGDGSNFK